MGCNVTGPKKILRRGAEIIDSARMMRGKGIDDEGLSVNWGDLMKHQHGTQGCLAQAVASNVGGAQFWRSRARGQPSRNVSLIHGAGAAVGLPVHPLAPRAVGGEALVGGTGQPWPRVQVRDRYGR